MHYAHHLTSNSLLLAFYAGLGMRLNHSNNIIVYHVTSKFLRPPYLKLIYCSVNRIRTTVVLFCYNGQERITCVMKAGRRHVREMYILSPLVVRDSCVNSDVAIHLSKITTLICLLTNNLFTSCVYLPVLCCTYSSIGYRYLAVKQPFNTSIYDNIQANQP